MLRMSRAILAAALLALAFVAATGDAFAQKRSAAQCGGFRGIICTGPNQYCSFKFQCGHGDMMGTCMTKPTNCPKIGTPVCGCDGKTYANDCLRQKAGTSLKSRGACG